MKAKKIVHEHFKSLEALLFTMEERPTNTAFLAKERLSSMKDETDTNGRWTGTNTYDEAMEIIKAGYAEPLDRMKRAILKIGEKEKGTKPRTKNDYVGFVPHVPNTIMNLPITMINRERQKNRSKTIHLTYSFCASADVSANQLITGGINFISLVNSLEKQGFRVKIDVIFASMTDKTIAAYSVNLKEYGQQLNLLKLAFPLVHPAMLRRASFKWLETTPTLKDSRFIGGYGTPVGAYMGNNSQNEKTLLKDSGIITGENSYYCNVYDAFRADDINELAKKMGLNQ